MTMLRTLLNKHKIIKTGGLLFLSNSISVIYFFFSENGLKYEHTYDEVNQKANQLARIMSQSIKLNKLPKNTDGDYIVAVNLPASDKLVVILLAIWKAGGAYLPLDQAFPGPRIEHIIREARPAIVIYDQGRFPSDTINTFIIPNCI